MKIGLLLGTFDPPHIGHLFLARQALNEGVVNEVWICPAWKSPWKPNASSFEDRIRMCNRLVLDFPAKHIHVCNADTVFRSNNTYEFLSCLNDEVEDCDLFVIIKGSDVNISDWVNGDEILKKYGVYSVERSQFQCSSSMIRGMIASDLDPSPYITSDIYEIAKELYKV